MGTIAGKLQYLDGTKQAIKQAIIEKGQPVTDVDTFRSYANKIRAISGGGGASGINDITFYDYDGTIVKSYSIEEFASVTELPTPPEHERLTFQGWNWSIGDIKALGRAANVGAMYVTKSGKTEIDITLTEATGLNLTVRINNDVAGNTVTIDWGDGTIEDAGTTTTGLKAFTHTYSSTGDYIVIIDGDSYSLYGSTSAPQNTFAVTTDYTCTGVRVGERCGGILQYAFSNCYSLRSISIPRNVNILTQAFRNCFSLQSIVIPEGVTSIGASTFYYNYNLRSISIPNSVTSIGNYTVAYCYSLQSIVIPEGVTSIGSHVFYSCYSLQSIVIPEGVTSIGSNIFYGCYSLSSVTIPNSVASIVTSAFQNCYSIIKYTFLSTIPPTLSNVNAFTGVNGICIFYVPAESVELYKNATNWNQFENRIKAIAS